MPMKFEWVGPEVFTEHQGIVVYHAYKDNDYNNGPMCYWFTTTAGCETLGEEEAQFDVRALWSHALQLGTPLAGDTETEPGKKALLHEAIERGWIKQDERPTYGRCPHGMFVSGAGACPQCGGAAS